MLRLSAMITLAVGFAAGTAHAAPSKAELLAMAAKGAAICAQHMPDAKATGEALTTAGLKFYDTNGQLRVHVGSSNRVAVGITMRRNNGTRARAACLIAVNGMTEAEGAQLIQPWVQAANAKAIPPYRGNKRWQGTFKGGPIILALDPKADIDFIDGAAIVAVSPN